MNILCIGDIVGRPGRSAVEKLLPTLKREFDLGCVIANAENSAGGFGLTERIADELFSLGCDCLTLGDHVWDKMDIVDYLANTDRVVRPANFPAGTPGLGSTVIKTKTGVKIGVINLLGRVFMRYNVDCPFKALKDLAAKLHKEAPIIITDFHAEATSEKVAMGFFIDGHVSALVGTHTHIQTADEKVLPHGTAYITDLGMTGPYDSVIGQNKECIIDRFVKSMPNKFEVATDDVWLHGAVIDVEEKTGKARNIVRIKRSLD